MSNWHVGQKVVCVKDGRWRNADGTLTVGPLHGEIVTISWFGINYGVPSVRLVEWPTAPDIFSDWHFRPIDALTEQMDRIEAEGAPVELEPEYA